ncbi:MAG: VanZ family protein [Acidipropionibacterium sp.]|jgi:glycopeptide antibiotics resistance protein|nr:VanZ family protein [Acidipropionibacterium sp.]
MIGIAVLLPDPRAIHAMKLDVAHVVQKVASRIAHMPAITVGDIASNIAAFIPVTLLLALGWRRVPLWVCGIVGMVLSAAGEMMQYLFPEVHRRPDIWNVVQNSIGAWIGVAIAAVIFQLFGRPHQEVR